MAGENILKSEVAAAKAAGSTGVGGIRCRCRAGVELEYEARLTTLKVLQLGLGSWCRRRMIMDGEDLEMLMKILV
jgi:hypothetical protein